MVCGWGINDVNYVVQKKQYIGGKQKQIWICPYYKDWKTMIQRCYSVEYLKQRPTYKGCTISEEWRYLSNFIKWVDSQPNKDWQNCEPDKDLLLNNNKHYSPETVVYISRSLNLFITDRGNNRGDLMIGVTPSKGSNKNPYRAKCGNPFTGKGEYLGLFPTELEAHKAWQTRKHKYACQLADLQDDPRVANILISRYPPDKDWTNT